MSEQEEKHENEPQPKATKLRMYFEGIQSPTWEHPADKAALKALQSLTGLDTLIKSFFESTREKSLRLIALGSSLRVTEKQFGRVYALHQEACKVLDMSYEPELFVSQDPVMEAGAVGVSQPFIIINSSMVETLDDDELLFILGRELGHIKSKHMLYRTLLVFLMMILKWVDKMPMGRLALLPVIAGLKEWNRKSELSADRSGLLVVQDPEVAIRLLMKMAGGRLVDDMDLAEFIKQAEEYNDSGDMIDSIHKITNLIDEMKPFAVIRVDELMSWVRSGAYDSILRGFYSNDETPLEEDMKKASDSYKKDFAKAMKPLESMMKEMQEGLRNGQSPWDMFDKFTKGKKE